MYDIALKDKTVDNSEYEELAAAAVLFEARYLFNKLNADKSDMDKLKDKNLS